MAHSIIEDVIKLSESSANHIKNSAAVALGRLGGLKGGPARAKKMTPAQRRESALKAAQARWNHKSG